jgi:hypothetical protein
MYKQYRALWPYGHEAMIKFDGLDDGDDKVKGIEGIQNVVFDELDQFRMSEWEQANLSLRGGGPEQMLFGLLNPISEESWVKKDYIDSYDWEDYVPDTDYRLSEKSFVRRAKDRATGELLNIVLIKTLYLDNAYVMQGTHPTGETYGKTDNEVLKKYEAVKRTNPHRYRVDVLGEWGVLKAKSPFCYNFDMNKHVKAVEPSPDLFFFLSFDFNIGVNAATLWQVDIKKRIVYCLMEFPPTLGIEMQCGKINKVIRSKILLPEALGGFKVFLTGDATGSNNVNGGDTSPLWQIVKRALKITDHTRMWVAKSNLRHNVSCELVNYVLSSWDFAIDVKCTNLINDCMKAEIHKNNSGRDVINKRSYDPHYLDTMRYLFQNVLHEHVKNHIYELN